MRKVEVVGRRRLFDGFSSVDEIAYRVEGQDDVVKRQSVERGDAVGVLVREQESGDFLLVRQIRPPLIEHGDEWMVEIVAGVVDDGEKPEESARREIEEEIGYRVDDLRFLTEMYGSPGGLSEKVTIYFAEVSKEQKVGEGGGVDDHEDVELVRMSSDEARSALREGRLKDAKTQIALLRMLSPLD